MLLELKFATVPHSVWLSHWPKSVMEQDSFNNVHLSLCWTVSSSAISAISLS